MMFILLNLYFLVNFVILLVKSKIQFVYKYIYIILRVGINKNNIVFYINKYKYV